MNAGSMLRVIESPIFAITILLAIVFTMLSIFLVLYCYLLLGMHKSKPMVAPVKSSTEDFKSKADSFIK